MAVNVTNNSVKINEKKKDSKVNLIRSFSLEQYPENNVYSLWKAVKTNKSKIKADKSKKAATNSGTLR